MYTMTKSEENYATTKFQINARSPDFAGVRFCTIFLQVQVLERIILVFFI